MARKLRVQHRVKTKLHNKWTLRKSKEVTLPHSYIEVEFRIKSLVFQPARDNAHFMRPATVNGFPTHGLKPHTFTKAFHAGFGGSSDLFRAVFVVRQDL